MSDFKYESTDKQAADYVSQTNNIDTKQAVKTIERAEFLDLHADDYQDMKSELDPEMQIQESVPAHVEPAVKKYMSKSSIHADALKNNLGLYNALSKQVKYAYYQLWEKRNAENELKELRRKNRATGLQDHEREIFNYLKEEQQEKEDSFKMGDYEKVPGQIAGVVGDFVETIVDNEKLILGGVGFGAGLGAVTPLPGGVVAGGLTGLGASVTTAMAIRAYQDIADQTFDELENAKGDDGQPLDLSRDQMDNIAIVNGAVSGILEGVLGKAVTGAAGKVSGKLTKDLTGVIVKNPLLKSAMVSLGQVFKTGVTGSVEETGSELSSLVAERYAKGEQSVEGFTNALYQTAEDIKNDPEVQKRLAITGAVGFGAGGVIAAPSVAVGGAKLKKGIEQQNQQLRNIEKENRRVKAVNDAVQSLELQNQLNKAAAISSQTELKDVSPEQMSELKKEMFQEAGFTENVYINETDMQTIQENNPEIAEKIRQSDNTQSSTNETSSGVGLSPHQFLDLVEEAPSVAEYVRLNPEAPNPLESKNLLERFAQAETKRQELFKKLEVEGITELSPEQLAELNDIDTFVDEGVLATGEQGYIEDDATFTKNIESVLPEKEVEAYKKAQLETQTAATEQIYEEFYRREERIEKRVLKANERITKEQEIRDNKKNNDIIEMFKFDKKAEKVEGHKYKGFSKLAIDPNSLPADLKESYLTEPKLKKRKVFVEGGITAEEAAGLVGVKNGEELLRILVNTPTQKEIINTRKKQMKDLKKLVKDTRGENADKRRNKVFDERNKLHLKEIKFLRENKYSTLKTGVKRIALPLPRIEELNYKAKTAINATKVGDLNPRQFNAAEKSHQKEALNHILKNEAESAFVAKEKAILNNELTRESLAANYRINKAKEFIKRLNSKKGVKTLEKANLMKPVSDIIDLFNLITPKEKGYRQKSYFEYLTDLDKTGVSIEVPQSLADIRQRGSDMTVEQFLAVSDRLRTLYKQATLKNKLFNRYKKREAIVKLQTEEAIASDATLDLREHPQYNENRVKKIKNRNSKTQIQKRLEQVELYSSMIQNFKNIVTELDREALGGKHYDLLAQPMVEGETFKRGKTKELVNHIKVIANSYGEKNFSKAFNEFINIEEFAGYEDLGFGTMSRSDMWMLFAYLGDPQARERIKNFKHSETGNSMNVETVVSALEKHLTHKDAKLAQNFVNIFKSYESEAISLHERTTGTVPTMVKGVPITFKGKVYDGGYVPNNYLNVSPQERAERFLQILGDKKLSMYGGTNDNKLYSSLRAAEMTDQGRLQDRTGSMAPLDTDFRNLLHSYEEHIHDIAYREAGSDVLKLLRNPVYSEAIINTVGLSKYQTLQSAVIETVGKVDEKDTLNPLRKEANAAMGVQKWLEQGFAIGVLGFNLSSVGMQPLSLGAATLRMGPKGGRYIGKAISQSLKSLGTLKYKEFFDTAAELNPDLKFNLDSIDDTLIKSTFEFIPETERAKYQTTFDMLKRGRKHLHDSSMFLLKNLDIHIKAAVTMGAYSQFMDGNVKNFSKAKLETMTEAQIETAAKKYVKQVADLALTTSATIDKATVEKISQLRIFTRFYTDSRSQLNTGLSQGRKISNAVKRGLKEFKDENTSGGLKHLKEAGTISASSIGVYGLIKLYQDVLRGQENPLEELAEVDDWDDFKNWMGNTSTYVLSAPATELTGVTPIGRYIKFAASSRRSKKQVNLGITQIMSDITMGITGLSDLVQGNNLSWHEKRSLAYAFSFAAGGIPINGPQKLLKFAKENETLENFSDFLGGVSNNLSKNIAEYIQNNPNETEINESLKQVQAELIPPQYQEDNVLVPEDSIEVLKVAEWDEQDPTTGAAGIYQFTEERWNEINDSDPTLGLTDNGRVSKDPTEQERAMKWELETNAKALTAFDIEVNNENLYGAHRFGLEDYSFVAKSKNSEKLTNVVSDMTLFEGFKTVADVRKYIKKQLEIDNNKD